MNNFDKGLSVLKKRCKGGKTISGEEVFREVAAEMEIPLDRLHFYLECINNFGMINYSQVEKTISITDKGALTKRLF